ncbi:hypothetical protein OJ996_05455 [Luteolibacter sp. GHJ8]|uniref:Uncharacterized protein n=1 Tax=Luteolibacter rhizosphaerae TaxID=2989719 RepID=A0ABT3G0G5_9BACT|nr:hypothetical protein [Luteolibacter rhizosphaerae]MCW1913006.1 hypothetical protein [Luteolibacter rhizosphaerae]
MLLACLLIEIVVLVILAILQRLPQYVANVGAGLVAGCFLAFYQGKESLGVNLGVCGLISFFIVMGAIILWHGVRVAVLSIGNLPALAQAIDIVAMQSAVAKSLAGKRSNPNSYGNRRVAEEVVRALTNSKPEE